MHNENLAGYLIVSSTPRRLADELLATVNSPQLKRPALLGTHHRTAYYALRLHHTWETNGKAVVRAHPGEVAFLDIVTVASVCYLLPLELVRPRWPIGHRGLTYASGGACGELRCHGDSRIIPRTQSGKLLSAHASKPFSLNADSQAWEAKLTIRASEGAKLMFFSQSWIL